MTLTVEEHFDSPEAFLQALSRLDSRWQPIPQDWIFRGQRDESWKLVPKAFRPGAWKVHGRELPAETNERQLTQEWLVIHEFLMDLDKQGLAIPGQRIHEWMDLLQLFRHMELQKQNFDKGWPPDDLMPLVALAQHYGLPTRLLDWSERPLIAAYFAAIDAAELHRHGDQTADRIAVWALSRQATLLFFSDIGVKDRTILRIEKPLRHSNPNLQAQSGLFTVLVDSSRDLKASAAYPDLQLALEESADGRAYNQPDPRLRKLTLKASQCPKLLRLLSYEWISATFLYPGVAGIAKGMYERGLWDRDC